MSQKQKIRVLYLDDETSNLKAFRAAFRRQFKIEVTDNVEEALRIADEFSPHVIFSDQRMPGTTGIEFF